MEDRKYPGGNTITLKEAAKCRHMVRKYKKELIPKDILKKLNERVRANNEEHQLNIHLVVGNADGLSGIAKVLLARGVNNYFVLSGPDTDKLDEKLGYAGSDLILYAQTLGLNTWWVGGMYSKNGAEKNMDTNGARINGIIAIGYGQTQGKQHKLKTAEEISSYEGDTPKWFSDGVDMLLYAPTALNKQAFTVRGVGNKVSIQCDNGVFSGIDLGIGKYHFELGAGKDNFTWA